MEEFVKISWTDILRSCQNKIWIGQTISKKTTIIDVQLQSSNIVMAWLALYWETRYTTTTSNSRITDVSIWCRTHIYILINISSIELLCIIHSLPRQNHHHQCTLVTPSHCVSTCNSWCGARAVECPSHQPYTSHRHPAAVSLVVCDTACVKRTLSIC